MSRFFGKRNIHEHERMPTDARGVPEGKAFLYVREIFRKLFPTVVLKYRNDGGKGHRSQKVLDF
jgi:hypothetical protein